MIDIKELFGPEIQDEMFSVLRRLQQKAMQGRYIYRGEPEIYSKVCSSLYLECEELGIAPKDSENTGDWFKQLWELQVDIVIQARRFLPGKQELFEHGFWSDQSYSLSWETHTPEYEILCRIRHYGGPTNLIDFTTDYLVALFFACKEELAKGGRVIFVERTPLPVRITDARVQAQRSVFVQAQDGFLKPDEVSQVEIPAKLKDPLLIYLKQCHGISSETMFPDIQGAVHFWLSKQSPLFLIRKADQERLRQNFDDAIEIYDKSLSIELDPQVLTGRGIAKYNLQRLDAACDDLNKAITLFQAEWGLRPQKPWGIAHYMRGITFLRWQWWEKALGDFDAAKEKYCSVATEFHRDFGGIADFEREYKLCLPAKIKTILTDCEAAGKT